MTLPRLSEAILAFSLFCGGISPVVAQPIVLHSGNGVIGGGDSLVNMLVGPTISPFASAFSPADFASAQTGLAAFIISNHPAWISGLAGDASAKWISTNANGAVAGNTALYAISFNLTQATSSATLDFHFAVDNELGTLAAVPAINQGVFLNGTAISGDSTGGTFSSEFSLFRTDIAPLLQLGSNTLYVNAANGAVGPAGLIFSATITTTPIPEPSALMLGAVVSTLGYGWRYGRQQWRIALLRS